MGAEIQQVGFASHTFMVCYISISLNCNIIVVVVIRILNENKTLTDNLERNESQIQQLRAENSGK